MKTFTQLTEAIGGDYPIYHNTYTSAVQAALKLAKDKGFEYSEDETFAKIGNGPKKPGEGKTVRHTIELTKGGKPQRQALHIQVYGMGNKYELNTYIS